MKKTTSMAGVITLIFAANIFGQVVLPRASQRQAISQTVGDTEISIVYHRPNVNKRDVWSELVPFGKVWRTGANEATVFEVSNDVTINGQKLPKGKYSLYSIPNKDEWTIIFNKTWDQWGTIYKAEEDALRVSVKPQSGDYRETMTIGIDNVGETTADVAIAWEKITVSFKVDIGDVSKRLLTTAKRMVVANQLTAARIVLDNGLKANYAEAVSWVDAALAGNENYNGLFLKSRLLNEMGKKQEAITTAEKALQVGKNSTPPANTTGVENLLKQLKGTQ
jgi:tetratricopeptide (TPR) repeat protein